MTSGTSSTARSRDNYSARSNSSNLVIVVGIDLEVKIGIALEVKIARGLPRLQQMQEHLQSEHLEQRRLETP